MSRPARALLVLLLAGLSAAAAPAYGAECRDETEVFQGTLRVVKTWHALNSTPIEALQVVFKPPICVLYKESVNQKDTERLDDVRTMHLLLSGPEMARLKRRAGASITVKAGKDGGVSPALTAWHIGDAIMIHTEIVSVGGKPFR